MSTEAFFIISNWMDEIAWHVSFTEWPEKLLGCRDWALLYAPLYSFPSGSDWGVSHTINRSHNSHKGTHLRGTKPPTIDTQVNVSLYMYCWCVKTTVRETLPWFYYERRNKVWYDYSRHISIWYKYLLKEDVLGIKGVGWGLWDTESVGREQSGGCGSWPHIASFVPR